MQNNLILQVNFIRTSWV